MTERSFLNGTRHLNHLEIDVDWLEVARLLGYPPGKAPTRVVDAIVDMERQASSLVRPVGVYRLFDEAESVRSSYLRVVGPVVLAAVSIGLLLERRVEEQRAQDRVASALILDAYGSAAVEAAADAAEGAINTAAAREGLRCSRRFSPGYGGWDVAEQRWIIDALPGRAIDITLTEGCMMTPRKSVTFAVSVGENPIEVREEDICATCGAVGCQWRDTPERCRARRSP